jgi:hypothetical protein
MGVLPNTWSREKVADWVQCLGSIEKEDPRMKGCPNTGFGYYCLSCEYCPDCSTYSENSDNDDPDTALDDEPREFDSEYTSDSEEESDLDASEDAGLGVPVPLSGERTSFPICLTFPPTLLNRI